MATKKIPVTKNVNDKVESIELQLEATGLACQGLRKWKATEATVMAAKISATIIGN